MIDLSDGLAADARALGESSGVCLQIELARLPLGEGVINWEQGATAGEDYELCFTVPPTARTDVERLLREAGGAQVTWIGSVTSPGHAHGAQEPGVSLRDERGEVVPLRGFEHSW
jgi:thiamine-monophosphate kinase